MRTPDPDEIRLGGGLRSASFLVINASLNKRTSMNLILEQKKQH